jgi:integrase
MSDVRIAPNIYRTPHGFRVYHREPDPLTGRSKQVARRFGPHVTLPELEAYRDGLEAAGYDEDAGFRADTRRYRALEQVKAMPALKTRLYELDILDDVFRDTPRADITTTQITEALHTLRKAGHSPSSCNKLRTALMSLWTVLDGRSAANPVRDAVMFEEAKLTARGQSYELLLTILADIPCRHTQNRGRLDGEKSGARLGVLLWTGMDPAQLMRMDPRTDLDLVAKWYTPPFRRKGARRRRTPRPVVRLPLLPEAVAAFQRLAQCDGWGPFSVQALMKTWQAACRRVEKRLRVEYKDPDFTIPHIRLKDLRHSFGTKIFEETGDLTTVAQMLQHAPGSPMTIRYSLGAVPTVLRTQMAKVAASTQRKRAGVLRFRGR